MPEPHFFLISGTFLSINCLFHVLLIVIREIKSLFSLGLRFFRLVDLRRLKCFFNSFYRAIGASVDSILWWLLAVLLGTFSRSKNQSKKLGSFPWLTLFVSNRRRNVIGTKFVNQFSNLSSFEFYCKCTKAMKLKIDKTRLNLIWI